MSSGHQSEKLKGLKNVWGGGGDTTTSREMNQNWQKEPKRDQGRGCVGAFNSSQKQLWRIYLFCYFY